MRKTLPFYSAIVCTFLFCCFYSCKNDPKKPKTQQSYIEEHAQAFAKKINLNGIPSFQLSGKALEAAINWPEYVAARSEIRKLEDFTLQDLVSNNASLLRTVEKLKDSIPQKMDNTPVESRINVLLTKANVLHQNAKRYAIDTAELQAGGRAIYTAFQNLKIQLNEVFVKQQPNFEMVMDQKQDSIQQARKNKKQLKIQTKNS